MVDVWVVGAGSASPTRKGVSMSCTLCFNVGWVLDAGLRPPLQVELIPCPIPDCEASGRTLQSLTLAGIGFQEVRRKPITGEIMAVGRPL
jgi:hypothetical protein